MRPPIAGLAALLPLVGMSGCAETTGPSPATLARIRQDQHAAAFGDFELPRQIGAVENIGLQLPRISPDGGQMLYLRSDLTEVSAMTLLGSPDPAHTPAEGVLSVWLRPTEGSGFGQRFSTGRWSHSPVWSPDGRAVAYVAAQEHGTLIMHKDVAGGYERPIGIPGKINVMPAFHRHGRAVLFCVGDRVEGPWRIYRQEPDQTEPIPVSPQGMDAVLPVMAAGELESSVFGVVSGGKLSWARLQGDSVSILADNVAPGSRQHLLLPFACIPEPVSDRGHAFAFYDATSNRVLVCSTEEGRFNRHRPRSIGACWLGPEAIALATVGGSNVRGEPDYLFAVQTETGVSLPILNGRWLPARYVPRERRLLLLGEENPRQLSVVELVFRTPPATQPETETVK